MKRTTVTLDENDQALLKQAATDLRVPETQIIRMGIRLMAAHARAKTLPAATMYPKDNTNTER